MVRGDGPLKPVLVALGRGMTSACTGCLGLLPQCNSYWWLRTTEVSCLTILEARRSSKVKVQAGLVSPEDCEATSVSGLPPPFCRCASCPWHSVAYRNTTMVSAFIATWLCPWVLSLIPLFKGAGLGPIRTASSLLDCFCKNPISK